MSSRLVFLQDIITSYHIQSDVPDDSLKYYYGPFSIHDKAMGGFALVNVGESTLTVSFIDYKGN